MENLRNALPNEEEGKAFDELLNICGNLASAGRCLSILGIFRGILLICEDVVNRL